MQWPTLAAASAAAFCFIGSRATEQVDVEVGGSSDGATCAAAGSSSSSSSSSSGGGDSGGGDSGGSSSSSGSGGSSSGGSRSSGSSSSSSGGGSGGSTSKGVAESDTVDGAPVVPSWTTGELIRLSAPAGNMCLTVVVEERRSCHRGAVAISLPGSPFARLRVTSDETVDFGGKGDGNDTVWVASDPTSLTTGLTHVYKSKAFALVATHEGLAVRRRSSSDPRAVAAHDTEAIANSLWHVAAVSRGGNNQGPGGVSTVNFDADSPVTPAKSLKPSQLAEFARDGCLVIPGLVPADVLFRAQTAVNSRLGRPGGVGLFYDDARKVVPHARRMPSGHAEVLLPLDSEALQGGEADKNGVGRMGGSATTDPCLLDVLNCPEVMRIVAQIIGPGKVVPATAVQVALRFPGCNDALVVSGAAMGKSVGGTDWHTDGLRQGKKHSFSLLVGIAISDNQVGNRGNLCLWPGSHHVIHPLMRSPDGAVRRENGGYSDTDGPLPDLGPPKQLMLSPGDVVVAHSELGHCGGPHLGSEIRSMLYFRVRHTEWKQMVEADALSKDMWCDLQGIAH